eukprot:COSAG01_NODE_30977_length_606_cov_0.790927_1_plen_114_part_00
MRAYTNALICMRGLRRHRLNLKRAINCVVCRATATIGIEVGNSFCRQSGHLGAFFVMVSSATRIGLAAALLVRPEISSFMYISLYMTCMQYWLTTHVLSDLLLLYSRIHVVCR